jgi:hypothetical protein
LIDHFVAFDSEEDKDLRPPFVIGGDLHERADVIQKLALISAELVRPCILAGLGWLITD